MDAHLNLINLEFSKIVRPVHSSKPVCLVNSSKFVYLADVHSVNSNKLFCLINLSQRVRPIDILKSVHLVNSNRTVRPRDVCKLVSPVDVCKPVCSVGIRKPFFVSYCRHLVLYLILSFSLGPHLLMF